MMSYILSPSDLYGFIGLSVYTCHYAVYQYIRCNHELPELHCDQIAQPGISHIIFIFVTKYNGAKYENHAREIQGSVISSQCHLGAPFH